MRAFVTSIAAGTIVLAAGCQTVETTKGGAVGVDRQQRMAVSSEEVNAGAQKAYAQMMAEAQKKNALDRDAAQVQRVKNIVGRLVPQTAAFRDDAGKWPWEAHVLSVDDVNAWCMPGGKIAVYTGLIDKLQATDDELAAVMGHEIAHALREHSREQMSQQAIDADRHRHRGGGTRCGPAGQGIANAVADVASKPKSRGMERRPTASASSSPLAPATTRRRRSRSGRKWRSSTPASRRSGSRRTAPRTTGLPTSRPMRSK